MTTTTVASVLIVDDEPAVRDIMARWVASLGLSARTAASADEALVKLRAERCDLAVIDIRMPGHDGFWLVDELHRRHPDIAVVLSTAYAALLEAEPSPLHIADLLIKPFPRERFVMAVERGRHWRKEAVDDLSWRMRLLLELRDRIENICLEVARHADAGASEAEVLEALTMARIPDAVAHGERVAHFAVSGARELGLTSDAVDQVERVALFHDIGKLAMPDSLVNKPSCLTAAEQAIVRRHVDAGAEILASTRTLHDLARLVLATHEWFGGGGYPLGLAGDAIPLAGRIIAVADSYDAMTQGGQHCDRLDSAEAVSEVMRCAGSQFDPAVVDAFLTVLGTHYDIAALTGPRYTDRESSTENGRGRSSRTASVARERATRSLTPPRASE
jgi:putative nucleotidyltransferase with HDIG domain